MLTENQLELLGDRIAGLYQELEQDVIADIARRIKKTGRYTETAELMAQAMYENGASPRQIRAEVMKILNADRAYQEEVAKNTLEWKKYIKSEIEEAKRIAGEEGNRIIADAGDMSFNADLAVWEQSGKKLTKDSSFTRLVREMGIVTAGTLKNLTRTMGFKGAHDFASIRDLYIHSLDKALLKMAAGAFSYDQAVNDCIKELAKSGLRSVDYASGRSYQLDTAVRMCIRTACHQLSGKISMRNCETTGTDLVEVDAHWGARPDHAVWQGKVYSRSGKNKKYPPLSICRYGAADGLMGVNCRHRFYPFFEGISVPNKWEPEPGAKEYNGKKYSYYDATQRQRKMERDIRATKREIEAQKAVGGSTKELEAKKRRQIKEYHQFSNAMDISAKDNRLRVVAGSSDLTKTKAYKFAKSLEKSGYDVKMKIKERIIGNDNFRIPKSKFLKAEYSEISDLKHSLSDRDVRIWYKAKDSNIKNIIDTSKSLEEQARQAYELRCQYRTQARDLMRDQDKRKELDISRPNKSFEELLAHKMNDKGMTREEAVKDIIATAGKTNKHVDDLLGVK